MKGARGDGKGMEDSQHKAGLEDVGKRHVRELLLEELAHPLPRFLLQADFTCCMSENDLRIGLMQGVKG